MIQIFVSVPDKKTATLLAKTLIQSKLAGCVQQLGPMTSTYYWQGKIETAEEWLCIIKTQKKLYKKLEALILKNHPYDVPEILAVPIVACSPKYKKWLLAETTVSNSHPNCHP